MTTLPLHTTAGGSPPEAESAQQPPSLTEALANNPFVADQHGQAMVEFAVVGPFLMFVMVSIWHFFAILDAQQDFFIASNNALFATTLGKAAITYDGVTYTHTNNMSDQGMGTGEYIGIPGGDIRNIVRAYPPIKLALLGSEVKHIQNGIFAYFNIFRTMRDVGEIFTNPTMPTGIDSIIGTPYQAMGLPTDSYYKSKAPAGAAQAGAYFREVDNPFRNVLLGLGSFFGNSRGGTRDLQNTGGLSREKQPLVARFAIVSDPWKADYPPAAVNTPGGNFPTPVRSKAATEGRISNRAGGVTFFQGLYGAACRWLGLLITSGMDPWLRNWHDMPYEYKVDPRSAANGPGSLAPNQIPTRKLKPLNGTNLVESWR